MLQCFAFFQRRLEHLVCQVHSPNSIVWQEKSSLFHSGLVIFYFCRSHKLRHLYSRRHNIVHILLSQRLYLNDTRKCFHCVSIHLVQCNFEGNVRCESFYITIGSLHSQLGYSQFQLYLGPGCQFYHEWKLIM